MTHIDIGELERFAIGEGLSAQRRAEIAQQLLDSAELRARFENLQRVLRHTAEMAEVAEPESGFEARLWARIAPQLSGQGGELVKTDTPLAVATPTPNVVTLAPRVTANASRPWRQFALAASLIAAVGLGIVIGRQQVGPARVDGNTALLDAGASDRVLAGYLAQHLGTAEAVFTRVAQEGDDPEVRELAGHLIASNRLYAAAAERAHRDDLAQFLREIEPVLAQLATGDESSQHLVDEVRDRDLAFKARVVGDLARRRPANTSNPI